MPERKPIEVGDKVRYADPEIAGSRVLTRGEIYTVARVKQRGAGKALLQLKEHKGEWYAWRFDVAPFRVGDVVDHVERPADLLAVEDVYWSSNADGVAEPGWRFRANGIGWIASYFRLVERGTAEADIGDKVRLSFEGKVVEVTPGGLRIASDSGASRFYEPKSSLSLEILGEPEPEPEPEPPASYRVALPTKEHAAAISDALRVAAASSVKMLAAQEEHATAVEALAKAYAAAAATGRALVEESRP